MTGKEKYKIAALKGIEAVKEAITEGRWEDFETYWSCCRIGTPQWVGKKVTK